jgi:hypothetical protein
LMTGLFGGFGFGDRHHHGIPFIGGRQFAGNYAGDYQGYQNYQGYPPQPISYDPNAQYYNQQPQQIVYVNGNQPRPYYRRHY